MKSIMQELYYGNISSPKDIRIPEKTRKKEAAIYEKLKTTLSEESDKLFEEFVNQSADNYGELMLVVYKRGLSMGMLLACEAFIEGDKL